jgi:hypothetical protein
MRRTIRHFSLHRIAGPSVLSGSNPAENEGMELRVVSDVEAGVLPLIQEEESVIRQYARLPQWRHRWVTLSILQDLAPLARNLTPAVGYVPEGSADIEHRPLVNVYDLANPESCHIFVNRQVMMQEGYWDDLLSVRGLLAHEHAHPLAENETIRSSRRLGLGFAIEVEASGLDQAAVSVDRIQGLLALLGTRLAIYAPREVMGNELAIRSGFDGALLHLDRRNVANACHSLAGRPELRRRLEKDVSKGAFGVAAADLLLLIGDLTSYLDLVLEVAPFYRAGQERDARALETMLEAQVWPHLPPQVAGAYTALREKQLALTDDLSPAALAEWSQEVLGILDEILTEQGLVARWKLNIIRE